MYLFICIYIKKTKGLKLHLHDQSDQSVRNLSKLILICPLVSLVTDITNQLVKWGIPSVALKDSTPGNFTEELQSRHISVVTQWLHLSTLLIQSGEKFLVNCGNQILYQLTRYGWHLHGHLFVHTLKVTCSGCAPILKKLHLSLLLQLLVMKV